METETATETAATDPLPPVMSDDGAAATAAAPAPEALAPTGDQVHALAAQLANNAQQYAGAEEAERRQEVDEDGDIFSGPYDPVAAMKAITEINREVVAAKAQWEQSKEQTKLFSDAYKEAAGRLCRVVSRYDALRKRSGDSPQPYLRTVDEETIEHRRRRLAPALAARGLYVTAEQLEPLLRESLDTLELWITTPGPIMPELVAKSAHVAGEAGTDGACCTKCGAMLGRVDDQTDYAVGAFVGLDCVGVDLSDARPTRRRGSPKGRRRPDPATESQKQRSEGASRSDSESPQ